MPWARSLQRFLPLALGACLVAGLLAWAGPATLRRAVGGAAWGLLGAAVLAYAGFFAVRGLRWSLLLRPTAGRPSAVDAAGLTAIGWMVSSFVPLKAGDGVRAAWMARRQRAPLAGVLGSVAAERALDVLGLAATASAAALYLAVRAPEHVPGRLPEALLLAWLLPLLAFVALAAVLLLARRRPGLAPEGRVRRLVRHAIAGARPALAGPHRLAIATLSLAAALLQALVFLLLLRAFLPDAPVPLLAAAAPLFLLTFVVAITPGHLGTYEAALAGLLAFLLGGPPTTYVPLAVLTHLATVSTVVTLAGVGHLVVWLRTPTLRPTTHPEAAA